MGTYVSMVDEKVAMLLTRMLWYSQVNIIKRMMMMLTTMTMMTYHTLIICKDKLCTCNPISVVNDQLGTSAIAIMTFFIGLFCALEDLTKFFKSTLIIFCFLRAFSMLDFLCNLSSAFD